MFMEQSEAVEKFVGRIKQKYIERRLNREKQWPPCKSEKLIRLELVKGEQRQGYSAGQTRGRDNKAVKRSPLAYSDILEAKDGRRAVRKVLVEGDAGIGKTTLCTALSEDWANGKLLCKFKILLLLHLRQKRIASADSLLGLLKFLHPSQKVCELVADYVEDEDERVLIIADGWDELSAEDRSEGSFLYELLFGECYSLSVIVTSRPSASAQLRNLFDWLVEVHGFNEDNIKEFIQCEFANDADKGSGLLEQLEGNPLIESVCSVPLNCAIICHLWHYFEGALPTTMTGLYTKIILNVILRNIQKKPEYENIAALSHFDALPDSLQQPWSLLCEIAFQTLLEDKIVFSYEDLNIKFPNLSLGSEVFCLGLLQSAESILVDGHGVSFHFLHLTFQEYLAALYLVRQPTDKQLQLCQLYAESQRFKMVWRFFFGLKFVICKQAVDLDILTELVNNNILVSYMDPADDDLCSQFRNYDNGLVLVCHFALEANQRSVDALIASEIKYDSNDGYVRFKAYTAFDSAAVIHVIANLQDCGDIKIDFRDCGLGDKQIAALVSALAGEDRNLHVTMLNLRACGNKLSDQNIADLFDRASPAFNRSLCCVDLSNNVIGPKTVSLVSNVLAESLLVASEFSGYDKWDWEPYTTLNLANCSLGVDGVRVLADALYADKLANLQVLSLAGSLTDDANINAELILALDLGHCSRLRVLNLSRNNLGVPGGKALGKIRPHLHSRVSLELEETMLGDEGLSALIQNLNNTVPCELADLNLCSNGIQATGVLCLAESVCTGRIELLLNEYESFMLGNNLLRLEGVIAVVNVLISDHFQASNICLSGCQLTTAGGSATDTDFVNAVNQEYIYSCVDVQRFICSQQLQTTRSFGEFVVNNNNFSGEGIHILAAFMYACPCVDYLYCCSCGITSNDLKQLLVLISELRLKLPHLYMWALKDNDIDDDGVSTLIQHLSKFPKLTYIPLAGNTRVSPGMLKALKEKLDAQMNSSGDLAHPPVDSSNDNERTEREDCGEEASPHSDTNSSGSDSEGDSSSDSDLIESEGHGEDSSSHMEDSDRPTEEQYGAAEEAGIIAVTLKDVENRTRLSSSEEPPSSKRVRTMEDEGVEQLQTTALDLVEARVCETTTTADSKSSQQEVVHPSSSSTQLDLVLDSENGGVSKHLGQIADAMYEWEGPIAEQLELTRADIAAIKAKHPGELKLQTRAALELWKQRHGSDATYSTLIKVFQTAGYRDLADFIKTMAEQSKN